MRMWREIHFQSLGSNEILLLSSFQQAVRDSEAVPCCVAFGFVESERVQSLHLALHCIGTAPLAENLIRCGFISCTWEDQPRIQD